MNKVVLAGRLTADPELKQTQSGVPVLSFSLAINRRFASKNGEQAEQQTDFINVVAWRQTAEFISKFFRKGSALCITGSIQTRSWQDNQGQRRYATEVVVDDAMFVDSRNEAGNGGQGSYVPDAYNAAPSYSTPAGTAPNFEELNTDDDLPF
ncbi:MAG: single-stranded DNA-binding protein [Ruminococcaceae bacterium]|nr:single-stranded DNA-binding protein [Oscillospiraceae bacterium]